MPGADLPLGARRLLRGDGSVVVPASVAADVLRRLSRDLTAEIQADGGRPSAAVYNLLWALYEAASSEDEKGTQIAGTPDGSASGTPSLGGVSVEIGASELAERMGCSPEYARRLARSGRVPARRVGRTWLIATDETEAA